MKLIRILLASLVFCLTLPSVGSASAQAYPNRPVRLIVPFAAGSGTDIIARIVSHKLGEALGQQIVVDNRPGANGIIAADAAAKAAADGYTLFMGTWVGLFAPAGAPQDVIARIHAEAARTLQTSVVREQFLQNGIEAIGGTPEQLGSAVRAEIAKWSRVVRDAKIPKAN